MSATPCPTCNHPISGPHTSPDGCIDFLLGCLAARDVALTHCRDHVRGLQHLIHLDREKAAVGSGAVTP